MKFEIIEGRVGDLGRVAMCKRIHKHETSEDADIPFFKISTFGGEADTFISRDLYELYKSKYSYPKIGDVLISAAGTIGKTVIFDGSPSFFQDSNIVWIDNDESKVLNSFLYYFYQTEPWISTNGSTIKRLYNENIRSLKINYPKLYFQQKIAKVLSDLDAKIELNNKINAELEAMAKLIYDYWFVQFDFPDENGQPYKTSGGKMVFNEELKREIPEGWEVKELGDCINIFDSLRVPLARSQREKITGNIPYYGATSIMGYVNDYLFDDDYILLAEDGSVMDEKGMPIVQFIWGKTWVNNHAHVIQAVNKVHNEFIYQLVKMIPVVLIKTGSIQMKINQENLKKYKVLVPDEELVNEFSLNANSIRRQLINNFEQNQKLAELRDWLLPMLMNGQVKVK